MWPKTVERPEHLGSVAMRPGQGASSRVGLWVCGHRTHGPKIIFKPNSQVQFAAAGSEVIYQRHPGGSMCTRRARPRTAKRARWFYLTLGAGLAVVCSTVMRANPIGLYAASEFTLINDNSDGAVAENGVSGFTLTGGNNGTGLPGASDLVTTVAQAMVLRYRFTFSTMDSGICDGLGIRVTWRGLWRGARFAADHLEWNRGIFAATGRDIRISGSHPGQPRGTGNSQALRPWPGRAGTRIVWTCPHRVGSTCGSARDASPTPHTTRAPGYGRSLRRCSIQRRGGRSRRPKPVLSHF